MSNSIIVKLARYFSLSTEELERRALRLPISDELRLVRAEKLLILSK